MKKKLMWWLPCVACILVVGLTIGLSAFLPKKTKADENDSIFNATYVSMASAQETGADSAPISEKGGAIYLHDGATYEMVGGVITGHTKRYGGAVYVGNGATFTMSGGVIKCNTATYGGAIYVANGGTCIISGGTITENQAESGPAIFVETGGKLKVSDDTLIYDNYGALNGVVVNYYVDGVKESSTYINSENPTFLPSYLSNTESCGYFLDEDLTYPVNDNASIVEAGSIKSATITGYNPDVVYLNENNELNVYTKRATLKNSDGTALLQFTYQNSYYEVSQVSGVIPDGEELVIPKSYKDSSYSDVILPVQLKDEAFYGNQNLQSVVIPALEEISYSAFNGSSLTKINLPYSLTSIGAGSFSGTESLLSIRFPNNGGISFETGAFSGSGLKGELILPDNATFNYDTFYGIEITSLKMPNNLTTISQGFMSNMPLLKNIEFPQNLQVIESGAVDNIGITELVIPSTVTVIDEGAIQNCLSLKKVTMGAGVDVVDGNIFSGCSNIEQVIIPEGPSAVAAAAFLGANFPKLTKVEFSNTIRTIGSKAFYEFKGTSMVGPKSLSAYQGGVAVDAFSQSNIENLEFSTSGCDVIIKDMPHLKTLTITGELWTGDAYCHFNLNNLPKLTSIQFAENVSYMTIDSLKNCSALESFILPQGREIIMQQDQPIFEGCTNLKTVVLDTASDYTGGYAVCSEWFGTTSNIVTSGIPSVARTYYTPNLTSLTIGEGFTSVDDFCFEEHPALTTVNFPQSMEVIGQLSFQATKLAGELKLKHTNIKEIKLAGFRKLNATIDGIPETMETLAERAFQSYKGDTKTLIIPESVKYIGSQAFVEMGKVEELIVFAKQATIINAAFSVSTVLSKVFMSEEIYSLGNDIFSNDRLGLRNIDIYCAADYAKWGNGWSYNVRSVTYGCSYESYQELGQLFASTYDNHAVIAMSHEGVVVVPYGFDSVSIYDDTPNCFKKLVLPASVEQVNVLGKDRAQNITSGYEAMETLIINGSMPNFEFGVTYGVGVLENSNLKKVIYNSSTDHTEMFNYEPMGAKGFYVEDWSRTTSNGWSLLTRDYGEGTEEDPYIIKDNYHFEAMINNFASLQLTSYDDSWTLEEGATKKYEDYGSIVLNYTGNKDNWTLSSYTPKTKYIRLEADIDYSQFSEAVYGAYASLYIDGNGYSLLNLDGEMLENTDNFGGLINRGYNMTIKNLNVSSANRVAPLVNYIQGGVNTFENVNIIPNANNDDITLTADDTNESMYMSCMFDGTVSFIDCKNYANYMSTAGYAGVFMGGYARYNETSGVDTRVYFENCINCGNIVTTGVYGIFFGNGTRRPAYFELKNCVNNGNIKDGHASYESHVLASKTSGMLEFFKDGCADVVEKYDSMVVGVIKNNGKIESLVSNTTANISGQDLVLTPKSGLTLTNGSYELVIESRLSFAPPGPEGTRTASWRIRLPYNVDVNNITSYTFEDVILTFIDIDGYINLGYSTNGLSWSEFMNDDDGEYRYAIDSTNGFYVFDLGGDWIMPPEFYGGVRYTLTIKDSDGNIIDFASGEVNLEVKRADGTTFDPTQA